MFHLKIVLFALLISVVPSAFAGFYSSSSSSTGGALATSVEIEGGGIYNLVVSVQFLREPYDKSPYSSDDYEEMIKRLNVEWRDVVLQRVLSENNIKISELTTLKKNISSDLSLLVAKAKKKHGVTENTEVVYSISGFYLVNINKE